MPVISRFEDRLLEFMGYQDRSQEMIRRLDEVLCQKAEKTMLKELREDIAKNFATKEEGEKTMDHVD